MATDPTFLEALRRQVEASPEYIAALARLDRLRAQRGRRRGGVMTALITTSVEDILRPLVGRMVVCPECQGTGTREVLGQGS